MLVFLLPAFLLSPAVSLNRSCSRVKTQSDKGPLSSWLAPSCLSQRSSFSVIVRSKVSGDLCVSVCFCAAKRPPPTLKKINIQTLAGSLRNCSSHASGATLRSHVSAACPSCNLPCCDAIKFFESLIIQQSAKSRPSPWRQQKGFSPSSFLTTQLPSILSPFIPSFFF